MCDFVPETIFCNHSVKIQYRYLFHLFILKFMITEPFRHLYRMLTFYLKQESRQMKNKIKINLWNLTLTLFAVR